MFSGLSNQVNSWMGAVKGEPHDEEVPTPTAQQTADAEAAAAAAAATAAAPAAQQAAEGGEPGATGDAVPQAQSPTKAGGMFSGMKTQMSGWLGNAAIPTMPSMPAMPAMPAIPSMPAIPGLRKAPAATAAASADGDAAAAAAAAADGDAAGLQSDGLEGGAADEEDRSRYISATEGADSNPGTPSEEKVGQMGMGKPAAPTDVDDAVPATSAASSAWSSSAKQFTQSLLSFDRDSLTLSGTQTTAAAVTSKVSQGAKSFGSFLYSAANKAGSKIKDTVKANPIMGEFNKEQDAFIRGQMGADAAVAPWVGHPNEEQVKEEILGLSADRRNFVRAPPAGVEFEFNYDVSYPIAVAIMSEDAALEKMRFELVPKIITEENFWRNYFYRVSLICQASGDAGAGAYAAGEGDVGAIKPVDIATSASASTASLVPVDPSVTAAAGVPATDRRTLSETSEFVSDTLQASATDLAEVQAGLTKLLGIDTLASMTSSTTTGDDDEKSEEHWEHQLESELQDFELVDDGNTKTTKDDANWENDVRDLLGDDDDCEDLK